MVFTHTLLCCFSCTPRPALDNAHKPRRISQQLVVTSPSHPHRSRAEVANQHYHNLHVEARRSPQTLNLQIHNTHQLSTIMPKRKAQADAESTAAPAKKTKAAVKKGKKATDENGTLSIAHFACMIRTSTTDMSWWFSEWRLVVLISERLAHGLPLRYSNYASHRTSSPNTHFRPLQYQGAKLSLTLPRIFL
jgi:hypothetical protein